VTGGVVATVSFTGTTLLPVFLQAVAIIIKKQNNPHLMYFVVLFTLNGVVMLLMIIEVKN
jgi:hypothetical protein